MSLLARTTLLSIGMLGALSALPAAELSNHTPAFTRQAPDLGATDGSKVISLTIQLKTQNAANLDQQLAAMYDPKSPSYHQWLDNAGVSAADRASESDVSKYLSSRNLRVLSADHGQIRVQGRVADVQSAFNVNIHNFKVNGQTRYANTGNPSVAGAAGAAIAWVSGLSEHRMAPHSVRPLDADGKPFAKIPMAQVPNGAFFSAQCFRGTQRQTFTSTSGTATYSGTRYGADITNADFGTLPPCGYQPSDIATAYNLNGLYSAGLDGTGQTIAIVDAFGSTTIQTDAAVFSGFYGLPAPDLTVIGTPTGSPFNADPNLAGWADETTLDVEWAHAIAPGAKIVLVVSVDNNDSNLAAAVALASTLPNVTVISNSYGGPESTEDAPGFAAFEAANKGAAARGISVDYSTGDSGDFTYDIGYVDASYPSSSPWATAVGGTSMGVRADGSIGLQTGWGNNETRVADTIALGSPPAIPPLSLGFVFGSGGGTSNVFAKPAFQRSLRGKMRQEPDIAWLADPYTGVEIIESTDDTGQNFSFGAIGGTSLSCPMFSGLWAIASQRARHKLGLAAARVYRLADGAIRDVVQQSSSSNVSGAIKTPSGTTRYSANDLAAPLGTQHGYTSALYNSPYSTRWFVLTFGTDTSLTTTPGWDNVTGLGTPNGVTFVKAVASDN